MPQLRLPPAFDRVMAPVVRWLRGYRDRPAGPASMRVTPDEKTRPAVPDAYMPLYTYLDRRYATTVVLTFEQIEALLGFPPPEQAFADTEWWTGSGHSDDRHTAAWTAARRTAVPQLRARTVAFERR